MAAGSFDWATNVCCGSLLRRKVVVERQRARSSSRMSPPHESMNGASSVATSLRLHRAAGAASRTRPASASPRRAAAATRRRRRERDQRQRQRAPRETFSTASGATIDEAEARCQPAGRGTQARTEAAPGGSSGTSRSSSGDAVFEPAAGDGRGSAPGGVLPGDRRLRAPARRCGSRLSSEAGSSPPASRS